MNSGSTPERFIVPAGAPIRADLRRSRREPFEGGAQNSEPPPPAPARRRHRRGASRPARGRARRPPRHSCRRCRRASPSFSSPPWTASSPIPRSRNFEAFVTHKAAGWRSRPTVRGICRQAASPKPIRATRSPSWPSGRRVRGQTAAFGLREPPEFPPGPPRGGALFEKGNPPLFFPPRRCLLKGFPSSVLYGGAPPGGRAGESVRKRPPDGAVGGLDNHHRRRDGPWRS